MKIQNSCNVSNQLSNEHCSYSIPNSFSTSSIQMMEHGEVRKRSPYIIILEDILGFFQNLFLFPILGHQVLLYQILLVLFAPILLPYILFAELFHALVDFCTCGYLRPRTPTFNLTPPTQKERTYLTAFVRTHGNQNIDEGHQIRLSHIMSRYIDYVDHYTLNEDHRSKHGRFQALFKIDVDGTSKLFQFCPGDNKEKILREYLELTGRHMTSESLIKHHFIGLDYQYFIGLLKMELKIDVVSYDCREEKETTMGICGSLFSFFAPKVGKHIRNDTDQIDHFALWPSFTRNAVCMRINRLLESEDLQSAHISLNGIPFVNGD